MENAEMMKTRKYWQGVWERSAEGMASLTGMAKPTTEQELADVVEYVARHGDHEDEARIMMLATSWLQAYNEVKLTEE